MELTFWMAESNYTKSQMANIDLSVHMKGIAQDGYMNQWDHSN